MTRDHLASRPRKRAPGWMIRLEGLLDLLAPAACAGCGTTLSPAARDRRDAIARLFCASCEARLALDPKTQPPRHLSRVPWPVHAALPYSGEGEAWLRRVKYPTPGLAGLDPHARALVRALADRAAQILPPPDAILPVPLHPSAFRRRTFNPALRWAHALARATGAPVRTGMLLKRRITRPQKGLGLGARRANVRGAFAIDSSRHSMVSRATRLWLVDDVVTTGATLEACIETLRRAGIECAGVAVCIARTPRPGSRSDRGPAGHDRETSWKIESEIE